MAENVIAARPTSRNEEVKAAAVERMLVDVLEYLRRDEPVEEAEIPEIRKSLARCLRYGRDGYQLARDLEHDGWSPDTELVETLDNFKFYLWRAVDDAQKQWVSEHGIKPELPIGTRVRFKTYPNPDEGEIVEIDEQQGRYLVKREKDVPSGCVGSHGTYVNYEDVLEVLTASPS